jgi:RNase H-like domain found in reverse transcriptase
MPFTLSKFSNNNSHLILSWLFLDQTQNALITDAATGSADFTGGLGAILTQIDKHGNHYAISFASRQLKDHEKNNSPFLLEAAAAVWGMEIFNEYLRGKQFILFTDHKPLEKLGHLHTKMLNRLQTARAQFCGSVQERYKHAC